MVRGFVQLQRYRDADPAHVLGIQVVGCRQQCVLFVFLLTHVEKVGSEHTSCQVVKLVCQRAARTRMANCSGCCIGWWHETLPAGWVPPHQRCVKAVAGTAFACCWKHGVRVVSRLAKRLVCQEQKFCEL